VNPAYFTFFGFEFLDKDTALRVCQFDDCLVEVITAGYKDPHTLLTAEHADIATSLKIRTILERVILGPLKAALDYSGLIPSDSKLRRVPTDFLYDVLLSYYPDVVDALTTIDNTNGNNSEAFKVAFSKVEKMLDDEVKKLASGQFGPLTKVILALVLDPNAAQIEDIKDFNLYSQIVEEIIVRNLEAAIVFAAAKKAAYAIPYVGQAIALKEIAALLDGAAGGIGTIADLATVPSRIEFNIAWGIEIKRLTPAIVTSEQDATITVQGVGFCIEEGWWFEDDDKPFFVALDFKDDELFRSLDEINEEDVSKDCRSVNITIPQDFLNLIETSGSKQVIITVDHQGDSASSAGIPSLNKAPAQPEFIKIGNGIEIGEINPNPAFRGQTVEVSAIGLSPFVNRNYFYISNKNGGTTKVPLSTTPINNIAKIKIPQDAITGTLTLEVIRIVNNIPEVVKSDPVNFAIKDSFVQIRYGDNGNFDDDQFAIYHNGSEINKTAVGQRSKIFNHALAVGQYTLEFKGLVAPDKLATYYVCLSDNVEIISGDSSGRVDTTEEDNPSGIFTSSLVIKVKDGNGENMASCNNATPSAISSINALNGD
jgi:hypothetical protein